jgi:hypothetical protein
MNTSYPDAVTQEAALLPVGGPLNGYPWCRTRSLGGVNDNTSWIWGRRRDAVIVSVFHVSSNASTIVIRRTDNADMDCK